MKEAQPKNRGGRPQKFPGEGPRITHATRLRPGTAERLAEEAERNHRSLGEEIEFRINKSFDGLVLNVPDHLMDEIRVNAKTNNRGVEEEAISRIADSHVAEVVKTALLSADFVQKQASIITDFMRKQRIGIIIGRILKAEADKSIPEHSKKQSTVQDQARERFSALKKMEEDFENLYGLGAINSLIERYDEEVLRLVHEASKGKYIVLSGQIQEVKIDPETNNAMAVFSGKDVSEVAHLPKDKSSSK